MLVLSPVPHADRRWTLTQPFLYRGHTIPAGFDTDLASFPRVIEPIMHRNEWCWIAPGVLHDWLYRTQPMPRKEADQVMCDAAHDEGAPSSHVWFVWLALRAFGWRTWNNHRAATKEAS